MDDKERFDKLPPLYRLEIIKPHLENIVGWSSDRMKILPQISVISATLLIIATFNSQLVPLNNFVLFIISILLILIPVSLFFYNLNAKRGIASCFKILKSYTGKDYQNELEPKLIDKFLKTFPDFIIYFYIVMVIILLFIIWG